VADALRVSQPTGQSSERNKQNITALEGIQATKQPHYKTAKVRSQAGTQQHKQPFYGPLSGTTQVSRYQKKHSPTHHPDHHPIFISFFHLPQSIASSLFKLHAWQSFCTTSFHVLFGLPLSLEPS